MADFEKRIQELEEAINNAEGTVQRHSAQMPTVDDEPEDSNKGTGICFPIVYALGALIPIITAAVMYFVKPKALTKKHRGKYVFDMTKFAMWLGIITLVGWAVLFGINYVGGFDKLQELCFGR